MRSTCNATPFSRYDHITGCFSRDHAAARECSTYFCLSAKPSSALLFVVTSFLFFFPQNTILVNTIAAQDRYEASFQACPPSGVEAGETKVDAVGK